ncbi:MAG: orotidine-5'-phosphate decarboxylase [Desulfuromonadaceae bacterium]|nr:orotidine-5'-phosphate decarboxylase [Desulfuromonas sp.]MDY0185252.1 orotidine-5'-phosphate decarboxylase [Desulfuromonadaceae bacterium]
MKDRLIFALDVDTFETAAHWVEVLRSEVGMFKVGKQLFTRCGPAVVEMVHAAGAQVFLDLKYHDIPNTVAAAAVEAARLKVKMFNVHALGGANMMSTMQERLRAAALNEGWDVPITLGVTVLTSSTAEDLRAVGIEHPVDEMVARLAVLARESGLKGVVASAREAKLIRAACGKDFLVVTPGVRPAFAAVDDQQRVVTPAAAMAAGADYIVVGRPISAAVDPIAAARAIVAEMEGARGQV